MGSSEGRNEDLRIQKMNVKYELWQAIAQQTLGYHQCGSVYSKLHSNLEHLSLLDLRISLAFS